MTPLFKPKTGTLYKSPDDWKPWSGKVISKLVEIHKEQYSIVVFSNQINIMKGKCTKDDVKYRFDEFIKLLFSKGIPILGFFFLGKELLSKTVYWNVEDNGISVCKK